MLSSGSFTCLVSRDKFILALSQASKEFESIGFGTSNVGCKPFSAQIFPIKTMMNNKKCCGGIILICGVIDIEGVGKTNQSLLVNQPRQKMRFFTPEQFSIRVLAQINLHGTTLV